MIWSVPKDVWNGERCFILGGGPSLNDVDVSRLDGRVIAINNAYLKAPKADVLYFADSRWYDWNRDDLHQYEGPLMVTRANLRNPAHDVKQVGKTLKVPLSRDPAKIGGLCGGSNALNLAYLFGADPIILLGFDMTPGNWHNLHRTEQKPDFAARFIPYFERMAVELAKEGRTVVNATPGTAMTCFPIVKEYL